MLSDPVALTVPPLAELAVDVYLPGNTAETSSPITVHAEAMANAINLDLFRSARDRTSTRQ